MSRIFLGLFCCCLLFIGSTKAIAEIEQLHVNTVIQMRYAITNVHAKLKNPLFAKSDVTFELYIPKEAFISNFTMIIKDQTYEAKVFPKQKAEDIFDRSQSSSALLQSEIVKTKFKDGRQVKFTARLDAGEKATFYLRYEELLERKDKGKYVYEFNVQPKQQKIEDFDVKLIIYETKPLKDISVHKKDDKDAHSGQLIDLTAQTLVFDEKTSPYNAYISLQNDTEDDINNGQEWKLVLKYDVERSENEVQISPDGKFIHYFSPDSLPSMRKHLIFVIDVSGSMHGRKIQQTIDAMTMILGDMDKKKLDFVEIVIFENNVKVWKRNNGESILNVKEDGVMEAYKYVMALAASGGTNISGALLKAVKRAKSALRSGEIDSKTQQAIVFLTDGEPTAGIRSTAEILQSVQTANNDLKIPIYSLAFGNGADFDFLTNLSKENYGFARQIFEGGNSFEQLEDFYNEISDPKLKNVQFQYKLNGQFLSPQLLTKTKVDKVFGANEYIIVGSFEANETFQNDFEIVLKANDGSNDTIYKEITPDTCNPWARNLDSSCPDFSSSIGENDYKNSIEHLWAYKRIFYLLEEGTNCLQGLDFDVQVNKSNKDQCREEAVKLAQRYNFVTDVTSMVIEETNDYISSGSIETGVHGADYEPPRVQFKNYLSRGGFNFQPNSFQQRSHISVSRQSMSGSYGGFSPNSAASAGGYSPNSASSSATVQRSTGGHSPNSVAPMPAVAYDLPTRRRSGRGRHRQPSIDYDDDTLVHKSLSAKVRSRPRKISPTSNSAQHSLSWSHESGHQNSIDSSATDTLAPNFDQNLAIGRKSGWQKVGRQVTNTDSCSLVLFTETYLRGESITLGGKRTYFRLDDFDDKVGSLQVVGDESCCWILYEDTLFGGTSMQFRTGTYQTSTQIRDVFKSASSARRC